MAGKVVGVETTLTIPTGTDAIPLVRPGDTTARHILYSTLPNLSVNVKLYGAVGDGSTDDTSAIQAACDAAYAQTGGGVVYFPKGIYVLTHLNLTRATSDFTRVLRLVGDNRMTTVLKFNTTGVGIDCTGGAWYEFENLYITNVTNVPTVGLLLARHSAANYSAQHFFKNVWVWGAFSQACVANISSENNHWYACSFNNSDADGGLSFYSSSSPTGYKCDAAGTLGTFTVASSHYTIAAVSNAAGSFHGCDFRAYGTGNILLSIATQFMASFHGCTFINDSATAPCHILVTGETSGVPGTTQFIGNYFEWTSGVYTSHGMYFYSPSTARTFENWAIIGNYFNCGNATGAATDQHTITTGSTGQLRGFTYAGNRRPGTRNDSIKANIYQDCQLDVKGYIHVGSNMLNCQLLQGRIYGVTNSAAGQFIIPEAFPSAISLQGTYRYHYNNGSAPVKGWYWLGEQVRNTSMASGAVMGWIANNSGGYNGAAYGFTRANTTNYAVGSWLKLAGNTVWEVTADALGGSGVTGGSPPSETGALGATVVDGDLTLTKRADRQIDFLAMPTV